MSHTKLLNRISPARRLLFVAVAIVTAVSGGLPLLFGGNASAAQITSRSLLVSTAIPSATSVQYTYTFTIPSTNDVEGLKIIACTTATGTYDGGSCSAPAGLSFSSATYGTQTGWQGVTNFAVDGTGANDCSPAANILCSNRTDATAQTATSRTIRFDTITNPSATNTAFFVGIQTYSTNNYTVGSKVDRGTVASATTLNPAFTINAVVSEILNFCVGSTTANDATSDVTGGGADDCSGVSGTDVNLGTLDTSTINVTPVVTNGGDSENGVAMLRTNAPNGSSISYKAVQAGTGTNHLGTLRISGATCTAGADQTDPCIDAQGTTQGTFTAGTEKFGMTVGGTNCNATSSYSCVLTSGTNRLKASTNYIGATATSYGTTAGFAWDETGTAQQIASSTTVVDDEALVLKFAATPSITTPFGSYSTKADFIAVTTY